MARREELQDARARVQGLGFRARVQREIRIGR